MNCDIKTIIEQAGTHLNLEKIARERDEIAVELVYNGFFYRDAAKLESRRILGLLGKCYKFRFTEQMTLFSYRVRIYLKR